MIVGSSPSTPVFTTNASSAQIAGGQTSDATNDFNGLLAGLGGGDGDAPADHAAIDSEDNNAPAEPTSAWTNNATQDVTRLANIAAVANTTTAANDRDDADTRGIWQETAQSRGDVSATSAGRSMSANSASGSTSPKPSEGKRPASATAQDAAAPAATTQSAGQPPSDLLALLTSSAASGAAARAVDGAALQHTGRSDTRSSKPGPAAAPSPPAGPASAGVSLGSGEASATFISHAAVVTHLAPAPAGPGGHSAAAGAAAADPAVVSKTNQPGAAAAQMDKPDTPASAEATSGASVLATAAQPQNPLAAQPLGGAGLTPMRAISSAVVDLASATNPALGPQIVPDEAGVTAAPAVRTMTLQLEPAHLGTVNVRLHVTGQTLDVELDVADSQTLGIVSRERDALASALRNQDYDLNSLVIKGTDPTLSAGDQNARSQTSGDGSTAPNDRQSGSPGGQGSGRGGSTFASRDTPGDEAGPADVVAPSSGNALFV